MTTLRSHNIQLFCGRTCVGLWHIFCLLTGQFAFDKCGHLANGTLRVEIFCSHITGWPRLGDFGSVIINNWDWIVSTKCNEPFSNTTNHRFYILHQTWECVYVNGLCEMTIMNSLHRTNNFLCCWVCVQLVTDLETYLFRYWSFRPRQIRPLSQQYISDSKYFVPRKLRLIKKLLLSNDENI